ncbi:MAG: hypothetical protein IKV23_04160 [Bacteroidaceae bacterium]|nr:hypothetical protein [Bacteroidaceae bacterium]
MKKYIAPEARVIECSTIELIAASFTLSDKSEDNVVAGAPKQSGWNGKGLWSNTLW